MFLNDLQVGVIEVKITGAETVTLGTAIAERPEEAIVRCHTNAIGKG